MIPGVIQKSRDDEETAQADLIRTNFRITCGMGWSDITEEFYHMRKNLLNYALLGLAATFCISAKQAEDLEEIAMAKCSRDSDRCYQAQEREYYPEQDRRYYEDNRARRSPEQEYRGQERRGCERAAPRCENCYPRCGERCGTRYCFPDARGNAGYTLDSAGRRRCARPPATEYRVTEQRNCDDRGRCQEYTKNEEVNSNLPKQEIVRKSAAQKVLEGY